MAFPQSFMDELTARSDIVDVVGSYVQLTRKGSNLFGLCPSTVKRPAPSPSRRTSRSITASAAKRAAALSTSSWTLKTSLPGCCPVSGQAGRDGGSGGGRRPGSRTQAAASAGSEPDAARFYYQLLQQPEGRAVQDYLDRRQIKNPPPSDSAWAPRWTPGTYCSPP